MPQVGELQEAERRLSECYELRRVIYGPVDAKVAETLQAWAVVLKASKNDEVAIEKLKIAAKNFKDLKKDAKAAFAFVLLADWLEQAKEKDKAIEALEKAVALFPSTDVGKSAAEARLKALQS